MIDHIGIPVTNIEKARAFYDKSLAPLGLRRMMDLGVEDVGHLASGYGDGTRYSFWIDTKPVLKLHFAFVAKNRFTVGAFYEAAIAAGGVDHGAPGLRPHYHKDYYSAFVLDADGHNVEAVCRLPE
jgi:catechol 2,3-dioxygenase-like lactoylglutathione lyase family enzyme